MAVCRFSGEAALFASTGVENLFLQEFLPTAPGEYIKVYLYALMQCQYPSLADGNIRRFAHTLGQSDEELQKAFEYWEKKGLCKQDSKGNWELLNVRSALFGEKMSQNENNAYEYAQLANSLAETGRSFSKSEYEMLYDLIEGSHFEEEAVGILVADAVKRYGKRLTATRLKSLAREWQQKSLKTEGRARQEILGQRLRQSPANKLLAQMGISNRTVTEDEDTLYVKWTEEWGFSSRALSTALSEMTGARNPNFKYLDRVLESKRERGETSSEAIRSARVDREAIDAQIRPVLSALGIVGSVSEGQRTFYTTWRNDYGLEGSAILTVAQDESGRPGASMKALDSILQSYARRGLKDATAIQNEKKRQRTAAEIWRAAGLAVEPDARETDMAIAWLKTFPKDVVLLAATSARDAKKPIGYLIRVMQDWERRGIRTISAAEDALLQGREGRGDTASSSSLSHGNEEPLPKGALDHLVDDLDES